MPQKKTYFTAICAALLCLGCSLSVLLFINQEQLLTEKDAANAKGGLLSSEQIINLQLHAAGHLLDLNAQSILQQQQQQLTYSTKILQQLADNFLTAEQLLEAKLKQSLDGLDFLITDSLNELSSFESWQQRLRAFCKDSAFFASQIGIITTNASGSIFCPAANRSLLDLKDSSGRNVQQLMQDEIKAKPAVNPDINSNSRTKVLQLKSSGSGSSALALCLSYNDRAALLIYQYQQNHTDNMLESTLTELNRSLNTSEGTSFELHCKVQENAQTVPAYRLNAAPCTLTAGQILVKEGASTVATATHEPVKKSIFLQSLPALIIAGLGSLLILILFLRQSAQQLQQTEQILRQNLQNCSLLKNTLNSLQHDGTGMLRYDKETFSKLPAADGNSLSTTLQTLNQDLKAWQQKQLQRATAAAARTLQLNLLPSVHSLPLSEFLDIAAGVTPCLQQQSALYDITRLDADSIAFLIGRAEGHDLAAMAISAKAALLLKSELANKQQPAQALSAVNSYLCQEVANPNQPAARFLTGIINEKTGNFVMAAAGSGCALSVTPQGATELKGTASPALGLDPKASFALFKGTLVQGDTLLLFTPEVTELQGTDSAPFRNTLLEHASRLCAQDSSHSIEGLQQLLTDFAGEAAASHDSIFCALKQLRIHF